MLSRRAPGDEEDFLLMYCFEMAPSASAAHRKPAARAAL